MKNKIAIFGGSFDPLHIGHQTIIKEAFVQIDISHIYIIPTYLNPFKEKYHFSPQERLKILKKHYDKNHNISIIDYEVNAKRPIASIETIQYMRDTYNLIKPYFIIGADNLSYLHTWDEYEKLEQLVEFVVASRDNIPIPKNYKQLKIDCNISSTKLRDEGFSHEN